MDSQTKLKRVVIKEELVFLTGDYIKALILNQFLYWSERTKDFDKFVQEEKDRFSVEDDDLNMELSYGWIYKSAEELNKELMLDVSAVTIRRHLSKLIKAGYIEQRHNPKHKWDRTIQYRPNIIAIQLDLEAMGYSLEGYPLLQKAVKDASFTVKDGNNIMKDRSITNEGAIPETTIETTIEITTDTISANAESEISARKEKPNTNGHTPQTGNNPPLVSGKEDPNEFEDHFGPNPRQSEIDNHKRNPKLSKDELLLQALGADVPHPIRALVAQMRDSRWKVGDGEIEKGIATFAYVTGFPLPSTKRERKQWEMGVRQHLEDEAFKGRLPKLYKLAWEKLGPQVRDGTLTITHPMAFTTTMKGIVLAKHPVNGKVDANKVLAYLQKEGIVEIKSLGDGSATYFWVETGEVVENIPRKYIDMVYQI